MAACPIGQVGMLRTESGQFIVKSAYNKLMENDIGAIEDPIMSKLCKSKLHYRLKMYLWRITLDILPTKEKLNRYVSNLDLDCPLCGSELETT